ncbi:HPF/RaiA family ribosome-associated protein [Tuwongella immobilis]|uniref:HPF/RaiA family ribosome-associated protein n=1 Tax=Tuwongella immobilis TaxID=692036 RepID=UPI0036F24B22
MKVSIRHGNLNEEHKRKVQEKAEHLLHYFDRLTMIEVIIDFQNHTCAVEVKVGAEHKHDFVSHHTDEQLDVAVDAAVKKLEAQIHRYKEKIQDHRRDPSTGEGPRS